MLILFYLYFFPIALPLLLIATILACLTTLLSVACGAGKSAGYKIPSLWARVFCWLTFVRVRVYGREKIDPSTSYVFVANHQGAYDIFAVYGWLGHNFKWMMKKSLGKIFLVGYTCRKVGHIFVDRSSPAAVRHTIKTAEATLRDGMSLVVFPEGARSWDGTIRQFKKGAYQLALEFNLPLVPITIDGSFRVLPRTTLLPRPGKIVLTIHNPIPAPQTEEAREAVMSQTRDIIASALPKK